MPSGRIAIYSQGLWRLRGEVAALTGMQPVRVIARSRPDCDAIAGWGYKGTATRARAAARRLGKPYYAIEDGPLRSVRPGAAEPPMSLVADRTGIYYDSRGPSDLAGLIASTAALGADDGGRALSVQGEIRRLRLSKYNAGPDLSAAQLGLRPDAPSRVLVVDQVRGDASIEGGRADAGRFAAMLAAAVNENPDAEIVVKLHPAAMAGGYRGHFTDIAAGKALTLVSVPCNPWSLLERVDKVYTVSSGLGFEAACARKDVVCFGVPFYAGWGFTDDRHEAAARPVRADVMTVFSAFYLTYARYFDPYDRREIPVEEAVGLLAWLRDRFVAQSRRSVCLDVSYWKRPVMKRLLDGPDGPPRFVRGAAKAIAQAAAVDGQLVAWASRTTTALEEECRRQAVPLVRVEDGFIRSAGLGAAFTPAQSLSFDGQGIYYDPRRESDLERRLQDGDYPAAVTARARALRLRLVATGTTKYNVARGNPVVLGAGDRPVVLVPGQVEDDASVRFGSPVVRRNIDLLRAARARNPDSWIIYKPHPDVEAGLRPGRISSADARSLADQVADQSSILQLIEACDSVETMTSLAGFEALLRGRSVVAHGQPFYAGWGLTEDLCPIERRTRRLKLDELVAGALILYPDYLDPVSRLRCGPELLITRIAALQAQEPGPLRQLQRFLLTGAGRARHAYLVGKARLGRRGTPTSGSSR